MLVRRSSVLTVALATTAIASLVLLSFGARRTWGVADAVSVLVEGLVGLAFGALLGAATMRFRPRFAAVLHGLITAGSVLGVLTTMQRGALTAGETAILLGALCAASSAMGLLSVFRPSTIEND